MLIRLELITSLLFIQDGYNQRMYARLYINSHDNSIINYHLRVDKY